ncbi:MAG: hypothetical protein IT370_18105 [Deltaproteobacteria bacterium]|nr:hypothetical protein [Deltaproteobacteria bacterium]
MGRKASKSAKKKSGGLLTGMRTGFQKSARAVTGIAGDGGKAKSKKQPWWSTALTLLLIAAVIVWLLYRRGIIK